jgi:hypothetical protein
MSTTERKGTSHHCYRCGIEKLEQGTLQLLPGSTHITLCPDCYAIVWGWHEVPSTPPPKRVHVGRTRR